MVLPPNTPPRRSPGWAEGANIPEERPNSKRDSARTGGQHQGLEDLGGAPVLDKGHHTGVCGYGFWEERQVAPGRQPRPRSEVQGTLPLEHHVVVGQSAAGVLAAGHGARELVLIGGEVKGRLALM